jgi:hypothetical protein
MGEKQEGAVGYVQHEPPLPEIVSPSREIESTSNIHPTFWKPLYDILTWTPPRCRHDPKAPSRFNLSLNLLFGFAASFTVSLPTA